MPVSYITPLFLEHLVFVTFKVERGIEKHSNVFRTMTLLFESTNCPPLHLISTDDTSKDVMTFLEPVQTKCRTLPSLNLFTFPVGLKMSYDDDDDFLRITGEKPLISSGKVMVQVFAE